jgi:hypothetical protein
MSRRTFDRYEWLALLAAVVYLSLPAVALFPGVFSWLAGVPPLVDAKLANFRALMMVVSPIGVIYLFALTRQARSLTDLTVLWRLFWVGPWLLVNGLQGTLEPRGVLVLGSVDAVFPLLAVFVERGALVERLRAHFASAPPTPLHRFMRWEGCLGFLGSTALAVYGAVAFDTYVVSFVPAVVGCYSLFLIWASHARDDAMLTFSVVVRAMLVFALWSATRLGYVGPMLGTLLAVMIGAAVAVAYSIAWRRWVQREESLSPTVWMIVGASVIAGTSLLWSIGGPWFGETCSQLATNIHRQDLIIAMFAALVGLMLADVRALAPRHALMVSWLLPLAALWFTTETKMLCHLNAGTPFHPSWTALGLAPVWSGNVVVDLTFSLATIALTAIGTTYTAYVCIRFGARGGWRDASIHGVAIILVSAFWMIATSTGVPGLIPAMEGMAVPALLPGDPVSAVRVHVADLVTGMFLITIGLLFHHRAIASAKLQRPLIILAWLLTLVSKVFVNLDLA